MTGCCPQRLQCGHGLHKFRSRNTVSVARDEQEIRVVSGDRVRMAFRDHIILDLPGPVWNLNFECDEKPLEVSEPVRKIAGFIFRGVHSGYRLEHIVCREVEVEPGTLLGY